VSETRLHNFSMPRKILLTILSVAFGVAAFFLLQRCSLNLAESFAKDKLVPVELKEALYWVDAGQGNVQCFLCPRQCLIPVNQRGFCRARKNIKGKLYCLTYGQPVAIHIDPVEKIIFHRYCRM
jgi:uncharacterized Fe-S radical SAM superfamily protein PflX